MILGKDYTTWSLLWATSVYFHLSHTSISVTAQPCPIPAMIPGHELESCKGYNGISSDVSCTRPGEPECNYSSICMGLSMFSREECGYNSCSYDKAAVARCAKVPTDNPITCKSPGTDEECTFDNRCFALHAGFEMRYCISEAFEATCASNIEDWHICGELKVKFKNPCLAIKSGFLLEKCERMKPICPTPSPTQICPAYIDEVICTSDVMPGKCKYTNTCWAYAAGYDASTQCEHLKPKCPLPNTSVTCPRNIDPVQCMSKAYPLEACEFDNECLAKAAGYNSKNECKLIKDHPKVCSKAWKFQLNKCASEEKKEIICGPNECIYDNLCIAKTKGYNKHMCSSVDSTTCPKPKNIQFDSCKNVPTTCGDNKCQYSNKCSAKSTGYFNIKKDCCNEPMLTNIRCPGYEEPVACGYQKKCIYRNRCFAKAAKQKGCCKLVPEDVKTRCTDYAPVTCGSGKCKYNSLCHAKAVGAKKCCPLPPENIFCFELYEPVKCGRCKYDNECLAQAAGAKNCVNLLQLNH